MSKISVLVYSWDGPKVYDCDLDVKKGDSVIVSGEGGNELGIIWEDFFRAEEDSRGRVVRLATDRDIQAFEKNEKEKEELIEICRREVKEKNIPMKVVEAKISLDGKQAIFAFTAEGRIDFRELVKNLSKEIKKNVRMQQIGSRDEARKLGGFGVCGREICCVQFPGSIPSISTDMARIQRISHRGTERISGLCGRLMCCLAYEAEQYRELLSGMPEIYSVIKTKNGKGTVLEINAATQELKVKLENGEYITIKKEDLK